MATTTAPEVNAERGSLLVAIRARWVWVAGAGLALLTIIGGKTGLISNYTFLQLNLAIMYAIAVLGLNLLTGFNGQISLGHGAFLAIGGDVTAGPVARSR